MTTNTKQDFDFKIVTIILNSNNNGNHRNNSIINDDDDDNNNICGCLLPACRLFADDNPLSSG